MLFACCCADATLSQGVTARVCDVVQVCDVCCGVCCGDPRRLTHLSLLNCADSYVLYMTALMSYIRPIYAYMRICLYSYVDICVCLYIGICALGRGWGQRRYRYICTLTDTK